MPVSEFEIIYRYFSALGAGEAVQLSVGDDCAIIGLRADERLAVSVDTLVAGTHFFEDGFPEDIGFKAVSVAASDLAAMGARPLAMTIALTMPDADELWLQTFSQGVADAVSAYQLPLVGGDTTRGPLTISVQVMGALPVASALLRGGAQVGDDVYVSGTLGDAAAGLALERGEWQPDPECGEYVLHRLHRPRARIDLGRALLGQATAAIDISDGLLADAAHIADASGVAIEIQHELLPLSALLAAEKDRERVLRWALTGGDDYELCYCFPRGVKPPEGTLVGRVVPGQGVICAFEGLGKRGYQHFAD